MDNDVGAAGGSGPRLVGNRRDGVPRKAADPRAGGVSIALSDDVSAAMRLVGAGGGGLVAFEVFVALDGETERTARFAASSLMQTKPISGTAKPRSQRP
jgi:hypothetical protein